MVRSHEVKSGFFVFFFQNLLFTNVLRAEIVHVPLQSKASIVSTYQPIFIGGNVLLYFTCIALIILFCLLPPVALQYTCTTVTTQALSPRAVVGIVYASIFGLLSVILSISYPIYAWQVGKLLSVGAKIRGTKEKDSTTAGKVSTLFFVLKICVLIFLSLLTMTVVGVYFFLCNAWPFAASLNGASHGHC